MMSDDYSPDETSWWPEQMPEEDEDWLVAEHCRPQRHEKKAVEESLKRLEERFREIVADLEPHGIAVFGGVWNFDPSELNLSACDPRSANLAELMFFLGCVVVKYDFLADRLKQLEWGVVRSGAVGTKKLNLKGDETTRRIRTAFAELLENDEDAIRLTETAIAERLFQQPKPPAAEPTIRKALREFRKEIQARAAELKILGPFNESKIRRVAKDGEGKPGVSFRTVQFFLFSRLR